MKKLFRDITSFDYLNEKRNIVISSIDSIPDDDFSGTILEEWYDYYLDNYRIDKIIFLNDVVVVSEPKKTKIKLNTCFNYGLDGNDEVILIDGFEFEVKIPFLGSADLMFVKPRTISLTYTYADDVGYETEDTNGYVLFKKEIKEADVNNFDLENYITNKISELEYYTNQINHDIETFNKELASTISMALNKRKCSFDKSVILHKKLNIAFEKKDNNKTIKLIKRKYLDKPSGSKRNAEDTYCISDKDYYSIIDEIDFFYGKLENTPNVGYDSKEETLRDMILPVLSKTFSIQAVGEAFRCKGKTDILIEFKNRAAFIAECKIWRGINVVEKAIDQLFNYTLWRDTKVSLILFNQKTKNFRKLLNDLEQHFAKYINYKKVKDGQYSFNIINEANDNKMLVSVLVFNYYMPN